MRETETERDRETETERDRDRETEKERQRKRDRDREKTLSYIRVSTVSASFAQIRHTMLVNCFLLTDELLASPRPVVQTHILRQARGLS